MLTGAHCVVKLVEHCDTADTAMSAEMVCVWRTGDYRIDEKRLLHLMLAFNMRIMSLLLIGTLKQPTSVSSRKKTRQKVKFHCLHR